MVTRLPDPGSGGVRLYAAHAFMDAFAARHSRSEGVPWISVNWDNWETWKREPAPGREPTASLRMTACEGVDAFHRLLALEGVPSIAVSCGDLPSRMERWLGLSFLDVEESTATSPHPRRLCERSSPGTRPRAPWRDLARPPESRGRRADNFRAGICGQHPADRPRAGPARLTTRQVFERPTIAELAAVAEPLRASGGARLSGPVGDSDPALVLEQTTIPSTSTNDPARGRAAADQPSS
jgi:hypothetical protein